MNRILTIAWVRYKLMVNSLRSRQGILNLISILVLTLIWSLVALGMAVVTGIFLFQSERKGDGETIMLMYLIILYSSMILGMILPFFIERGQSGFSISRLLVFPMRKNELFLISLGATSVSFEHLIYYPMLISFALSGFILPGRNILWGGVFILSSWTSFIVWGHALSLGLEAVVRDRKKREVLALLTFAVIILAAFSPSIIESLREGSKKWDIFFLKVLSDHALAAVKWLVPYLAAKGLFVLREGDRGTASKFLLLIWCWTAVGLAVGRYIFSSHLFGMRGTGRARQKKKTGSSSRKSGISRLMENRVLRSLPGVTVAVAAKDMRYLFQSLVGKFALFIVPVLTVLAAVMFSPPPGKMILGFPAERLVLIALLVYIAQVTDNLANNSFAWEGRGVDSYFYFPVSLKEVLLGKNIALWSFNGLLFVISMITWSLIRGFPGLFSMVLVVLITPFMIMVHTGIGNFLSIAFPVPKDIASRDSRVSQTAMLLSFGELLVIAIFAGGSIFIPALLGLHFLQPVLLGVLLAAIAIAYRYLLGMAAGLMVRRQEQICSALKARN